MAAEPNEQLTALGEAAEVLRHAYNLNVSLIDGGNPINPFGLPFIQLPERYTLPQVAEMLSHAEVAELTARFAFERGAQRVEGTVQRSIQHMFSTEEMETLRDELVNVLQQKEETEEELKNVSGEYRQKIKVQKARIANTSGLIRQRYEYRELECFKVLDPTTGRVFFQEVATGRYVESRVMTGEERQLELELPLPEDGPEADEEGGAEDDE